MSSLDELSEMLAGRCEEFFVNDFDVNWRYYSDPHTATESMDGTLIVTGLTPEQAVNATLGTGTCYDVCDDPNDFVCSECGAHMFIEANDTYTMMTSDENIIKRPNFCPNCGARVVEVDE